MKKLKHLILSAGLLSMVALVAVGCGSTQTAAPKADATKTTATAAATYVGDDTCNSCHGTKVTAFHTTKHSTAFQPLSAFKLSNAPTTLTLFDGVDTNNTKPTQVDLSKIKIYGVMMNEYVMAEVPGFKNKIYRIAKLVKNGDQYTLDAAKSVDVDKDGKPDWQAADGTSCASCHAPGVPANSPSAGISCESCHGPGSNHVAAPDDKKKGTIMASPRNALPDSDTCLKCHNSDPVKDATTGAIVTNNHQGTRDWAFSKHNTSGMTNGCLTCHGPHKANANGVLIKKDNPVDICNSCHEGKIDQAKLDAIMWKNTTDPNGHVTRDHSFGAMKYQDMGDDPATKQIEIKNQTYLDIIKKALPDLAK
ncbi:cytochrome c3 family protein [Desulfitobacterium sp. Sab5]|uniref:cytochrome c3 family protein n=1 Tax=Desulfitobacterium nosdiversum TaxID=3375356 RepID=UPI003CF8A8D7